MAATQATPIAELVTNAPVEIAPVTVKVVKAQKPRVPKAPAAHPTYFQMIKKAILWQKERAGSSPYAIAKFLKDKYKTNLPHNFRKTLALELEKWTDRGKLKKVRNSYKLKTVPKVDVPKAAPKKVNATMTLGPSKEVKDTADSLLPKSLSKTKASPKVVKKKAIKTSKGTKVKLATAITKKVSKPRKAIAKKKASTTKKAKTQKTMKSMKGRKSPKLAKSPKAKVPKPRSASKTVPSKTVPSKTAGAESSQPESTNHTVTFTFRSESPDLIMFENPVQNVTVIE
ncbi:unnamed protein product [Calypogeia fissa]